MPAAVSAEIYNTIVYTILYFTLLYSTLYYTILYHINTVLRSQL